MVKRGDKTQDKHDDNNYEGTDNDEIESEQDKESIRVEMNERIGRRHRVSKGEQSVGSMGRLAKGTRSHTARDYNRRVRK